MIYNQDICKSGELVLPDEQEVLGWGQLDFSENIKLDLGAGEIGFKTAGGETIGAFVTVTDTHSYSGNQTGRCVFTRIKHVQDDTDYSDRLILPFLRDDTVWLVELMVYIHENTLYVDCTTVASVGSIADSVTSADNIVYEPVLYAK